MKVISYNGIEKKIDKIAELGGFDPDTQEELESFIEKAVFDVEPIVYCRDCKWYEWGMTECHNPRYGDGWANYPSPQVHDEYFCKDGERKDEGEA